MNRLIMRRAKKIALVMGLLLPLLLISTSFANAQLGKSGMVSHISDINVVETYSAPIKEQDIYTIKEEGRDDLITPRGYIYEEYVESTYQILTYGITAYDVGPSENQKFLISVAKGSSIRLTESTEVSGTVKISGTTEAGVKIIVNMKLTGEASGTVTKVWGTDEYYGGPEGNYTTRNYYTGVEYDRYGFTLSKTDRYAVYDILPNGNKAFIRYEYYRGNNITLNDVKKPKIIKYYRDINY